MSPPPDHSSPVYHFVHACPGDGRGRRRAYPEEPLARLHHRPTGSGHTRGWEEALPTPSGQAEEKMDKAGTHGLATV